MRAAGGVRGGEDLLFQQRAQRESDPWWKREVGRWCVFWDDCYLVVIYLCGFQGNCV